MTKHNVRIALRRWCLLFLPFGTIIAAAASPVIDDAALEEKFAAGLLKPGIDGLDGKAASRSLAAASGRTAAIEPATKPGAPGYEELCRSVVVVGTIEHCKKCKDWHMGAVSSGWVIDRRGRIVTNYHVLADKSAGEIGVMTFDGNVFPVRKVLAADVEGDAAIVEIDPGGGEIPALPLASEAATGEEIRVVGHPDGRFYSLTEGIVSRLFREETSDGKGQRTWLTVTADYGGGSSGAPVINAAGKVVGMVSSTAALLADTEEGREPGASDVQMVFRDCVSAETIRSLCTQSGGERDALR